MQITGRSLDEIMDEIRFRERILRQKGGFFIQYESIILTFGGDVSKINPIEI